MRIAWRLGLITGVAAAIPFLILQVTGIRINLSSSLPVGLYIATKDHSASFAEFCPSEPYASLAIQRGYRQRGDCPDGATPLLKPIVAVAGDTVEVSRTGISVNGRLLPNTEARAADTTGRPMPTWPNGVHRVRVGTVWVASSFNSKSFDSRYFGPIATASIRQRLLPLLTE